MKMPSVVREDERLSETTHRMFFKFKTGTGGDALCPLEVKRRFRSSPIVDRLRLHEFLQVKVALLAVPSVLPGLWRELVSLSGSPGFVQTRNHAKVLGNKSAVEHTGLFSNDGTVTTSCSSTSHLLLIQIVCPQNKRLLHGVNTAVMLLTDTGKSGGDVVD